MYFQLFEYDDEDDKANMTAATAARSYNLANQMWQNASEDTKLKNHTTSFSVNGDSNGTIQFLNNGSFSINVCIIFALTTE